MTKHQQHHSSIHHRQRIKNKKNGNNLRGAANLKSIQRSARTTRKKTLVDEAEESESINRDKSPELSFDDKLLNIYKMKFIIKCQHCNEQFIKPKEIMLYTQHMQKNRCETCKKKFNCNTEVKLHGEKCHKNRSKIVKNSTVPLVPIIVPRKPIVVPRKPSVVTKSNKYYNFMWTCKFCKLFFRGLKILLIHQFDTWCKPCQITFDCSFGLSKHIRKYHTIKLPKIIKKEKRQPKNKFKCSKCSEKFPTKGKLTRHMAIFCCSFCDSSLVCKNQLVSHIQEHLSAEELSVHRQTKHQYSVQVEEFSEDDYLKCPHCGLKCPDLVGLESHSTRGKCAICDEDMNCFVDILVHQRTCALIASNQGQFIEDKKMSELELEKSVKLEIEATSNSTQVEASSEPAAALADFRREAGCSTSEEKFNPNLVTVKHEPCEHQDLQSEEFAATCKWVQTWIKMEPVSPASSNCGE